MRKIKIDKEQKRERNRKMKNRHSPRQQNGRGRPPLLFNETVPGRIYAQLGSLESIRRRLKFHGETAHDLIKSAGFNPAEFSNEWISQIIETIFRHAGRRNPLSRSHCPQWRIARVLRNGDGFQDSREIDSVAHHLASKQWIMKAIRLAGSFRQLLTQLSIPLSAEKRLRQILLEIGIHIPKLNKTVKLRCRICHRTFTRSVSYERRFASQRKKGPLCGHKHSVIIS